MPRRDYRAPLRILVNQDAELLLHVLLAEVNMLRDILGLPPRTNEDLTRIMLDRVAARHVQGDR